MLERNTELEEYYMSRALQVAKAALDVGEVPVGCVIVLREAPESLSTSNNNNNSTNNTTMLMSNSSVIISHGANQVNATRDATRHAEIIAIDRMLTGSGISSDQLRLPQHVIAKAAHGNIPNDNPMKTHCQSDSHDDNDLDTFQDSLINVKEDPFHWKNSYGYGSGRIFPPDIFSKCDLYVTCEPCIMCAAALAQVGIGRVFYGCKNDRFGGCGSLMNLHLSSTFPSTTTNSSSLSSLQYRGYPIISGILENEAVTLLRSFYDRENFHAPDEKRKRKPPIGLQEH